MDFFSFTLHEVCTTYNATATYNTIWNLLNQSIQSILIQTHTNINFTVLEKEK